jgi:hypothetical protein
MNQIILFPDLETLLIVTLERPNKTRPLATERIMSFSNNLEEEALAKSLRGNPRIIILVGLPGTGKSCFANWLTQKDPVFRDVLFYSQLKLSFIHDRHGRYHRLGKKRRPKRTSMSGFKRHFPNLYDKGKIKDEYVGIQCSS